ncbi:MAG: 4Fe-4S dicluster domain-containing protein [Deltaproteobacteria bacterium]|nr:MAG: 4Fe-4S dicluster domain-containing protein [Deltaproteobacteria bacterium]
MVFDILFYTSLAIFILGLIYKISTWFTRKIGIMAHQVTTADRVSAATRGILTTFFSRKILILIKVFILDVLLQLRILRENYLRWLMHMLIFWGFMLLVLMHALEGSISEPLFSDYYSTVNPYMFLRDLFGFMVIVGIGIAIYRRFILKVPRLSSTIMDRYAIIIVAMVMLSGIFLEGLKITSHSEFMRMVEDYAGLEDQEEIQPLESFWVQHYGLVSPNLEAPFDEEVLAQGEELHEGYCMDCHSKPQSAFSGYAASKIIRPIASALDQAGGVTLLWYFHILSCFIGLAYLPFSKMFHVFATPVSLMVGAVMDKAKSAPANIATRQAIELDACMHCNTCSLRCSVAVAYDNVGNRNIRPSEKIQFLRAYAANKDLDSQALRAIQEGIYLCTNCDRCTVFCPAGITLKDMWLNVREELIQKGHPVPLVLSQYSWYRGLNRESLEAADYSNPLDAARKAIADNFELINQPEKIIPLTPINKGFKEKADRSGQAHTYSYCFSCENCSTVCPVVENYENPQEVVGMLPHQIMRALGLGLKDLAMGSRMLWDCLTCYQCQEHCPQGVKVTDVLYELKNQALKETFATDKKETITK